MPSDTNPRRRAEDFCRRFGLRVPILQAPMAGACPAGLAAAVGNAGGMGGLGALLTAPDGIAAWAEQFRGQSNGTFQINLWVPDPPPLRDPEHERLVREFLGQWGPPVTQKAGDAAPIDFAARWPGCVCMRKQNAHWPHNKGAPVSSDYAVAVHATTRCKAMR